MIPDYSSETIEQASAEGNLARVQDWTQKLSVYRGAALEKSMLRRLQFSSCEAVRHGHPAVFSQLLDQILSIDDDVIESAKEGQSVEIFKLCWNIGGTSTLTYLVALHRYGNQGLLKIIFYLYSL